MTTTIFTRIINGELPCAKVYEDEHVFAFMDAGQVKPGLDALRELAKRIVI